MSSAPSPSSLPPSGASSSQGSAPNVKRQRQPQPHSQFFIPFDPESPLFVAKGVLSTGALGALTGASIGVVRNQNPFALSINMTINLSIAGLTFFSIREYLVSPLLLSIDLTPSHTRRYNDLLSLSEKQLGKLPSHSHSHSQSLTEVRVDRVADSALAGALTGGVLSAAFRGRATFGKAALTSSLIASALQLSVNQLRVFRLKALAKNSEGVDVGEEGADGADRPGISPPLGQGQETVSGHPNNATSSSAGRIASSSGTRTITNSNPNPPLRGETIMQSFEDPLKAHDPLHNPDWVRPRSGSGSQGGSTPTHTTPLSPSFPERMMTSLSKFLPVRKLSDDEYLATLEKKRADVDKRLGEIEDEERRMYAWAESQGQGQGPGRA
ncbi:hypothetical protein IAU59_003851 [Kwoniella sp. CBS 9459]